MVAFLYEVLSGRPPFSGSGPAQVLAMHLYQEPLQLSRLAPKVPPDIAELVHRLLIKDKEKRPSMAEAADEIGRLLARLTGGPQPARSRAPMSTDPQATRNIAAVPANADTTLGRSNGQHTARRRIRYLGVGVAGLALLTLTVLLLRRPPADPTGGKQAPVANATPVPAPPPPRTVVWRILTSPPGAEVLNPSGTKLGVTPWRNEQPAGTGELRLRIVRDGYQEAVVTIDASEDVVQQISLNKLSQSATKRTAAKQKKKDAPPKKGIRSMLQRLVD